MCRGLILKGVTEHMDNINRFIHHRVKGNVNYAPEGIKTLGEARQCGRGPHGGDVGGGGGMGHAGFEGDGYGRFISSTGPELTGNEGWGYGRDLDAGNSRGVSAEVTYPLREDGEDAGY